MFRDLLSTLLERRDLTDTQMRTAMSEIMTGNRGEVEIAAFLVALRAKGETAEEIAAAASVLREHMVRLETGRSDLLDTCGTGGDASGTFNISTAAAIVAAGAGVPVVKHGNRAQSSRTGSADVLTALGVRVESDPDWLRGCLEKTGMAFCFAPHFHPAMRHVAPVRKSLGIRTIFNLLGPLANPAGAAYQLIGVGKLDLLDRIAGALARLGTKRAFVVCGCDGLDEVTLAAPTRVRKIEGSMVTRYEWSAQDFDLPSCRLEELRAEGPEESAKIIRDILEGKTGPARDIVVANAAAALMAAGTAQTPKEAAAMAAETIASGRAREVLEKLVEYSKS